MIVHDFLQLHDRILGTQTTTYNIQYDDLVALVYKDVGAILLEIYQVYFPHEVRGMPSDGDILKLSERGLFEFLSDYDLCPQMVTKSLVYKIFTYLKS